MNLDPQLLNIFNVAITTFGALLLFRMETETSRDHPWARHLAIALVIFTIQYVAFTLGLKEKPVSLVGVQNGLFWTELFGIPINLFLMSSASILLNRRIWWPGWFLALIGLDLIAVTLVFLGVANPAATDPISIFCRIAGDSISFITLMHFAYASYNNTKFYRNPFALILGIVIGGYGGMHLISPFIPNIAASYSPNDPKAMQTSILTVFTFVAALFKLAVLYSAVLITTLENETLIKLHTKLRESVDNRIVFFSRDGILKAINDVFLGTVVRLYIRIPIKDAAEKRLAHVYFSEKGPDYESTEEEKTPLPELLKELTLRQQKDRDAKKSRTVRSFLIEILQGKRTQRDPPFRGVAPIRYHGGLIGCLELKKNGAQRFTYSEARLSLTLSKDISALVQFYRVQESLRVLIEGFNINIEPLSGEGPPEIFSRSLNRRFENVIQCVLSPLRTRFVVDTGFFPTSHPPHPLEGELTDESQAYKIVPYECVTDEAGGEMTIGQINLDYQRARDPVDTPSLGYFRAYGKAVGSIVASSFLTRVEQKLNLIIRNLTFELTKKLDFEKWLEQVQASVKKAELEGVVVYHPGIRNFSKFVRDNDTSDNKEIGAALAAAYPSPREVLNQLESSPTKVSTADKLIIGMKVKLDRGDAALFVGVSRSDFAAELEAETPWRNFLINLASVAGSALERVIYARDLQRSQIKQTEDYMVLSTAEKVGLITHELLSHIENLSNNGGLVKFELPESLEEAIRKPIELRIDEMRKEFAELRSLTGLIRRSAQIPEQSGPSSLKRTLQKLATLHESGSNVRVRIEGIKNRSQDIALDDVVVKLPSDIVELTFGNLIRNSMAAIKRKAGDEKNGSSGLACQGLIRIWVEVVEEENVLYCFINDNGCGIPTSMKEKIFDLNVSSTPGQGGWGLFYVKRKLGRNGGSVSLDYSEPGNTTFRVCLPLFLDKAA